MTATATAATTTTEKKKRMSSASGLLDDDEIDRVERGGVRDNKSRPAHRYVRLVRMVRARQWKPLWLMPLCLLEWNAVAWITYGFTVLLENPYCDAMFACGCQMDAPFGVGWNNCNVHNPSGPRCPFCAAPASVNWMSFYVPPLTALAVYVVLSLKLCRRPWWQQLVAQIVAAIATWLATETTLGLAFLAGAPHYGYFLGVGTAPGHRWSWVPPPKPEL
jgi:hypothetical protein